MSSETGSPDHPQDFRPQRGENHPNQPTPIESKLQLTREEIRALKECNRESFWYRCVPLSVSLATATHLAVQRGLLKGHPTRGALGKSIAAIGIGYIIGKWSYQGVCRDKILALENSPLAEAYRRQQQKARQGGSFTDVVSENALPESSKFSRSTSSTEDYQNNEIDTDSNVAYRGLDDKNRPNIDTDAGESNRFQEQGKQASYTSFEDMRKKNREDYAIRNTPSSRTPPPSRPVMPTAPDASQNRQPPSVYMPPETKLKRTKKNQYGDIWDE